MEPAAALNPVNSRRATPADRKEWVRMRDALWPGSRADHESETHAWFVSPRLDREVFVLQRAGGTLGGFAEVSLRSCAEGCDTSPVGFLEGLFIDSDLRGGRLARQLVEAAESWTREQGCAEMASDITSDNQHSYNVHLALGYLEVERLICFRKSLSEIKE